MIVQVSLVASSADNSLAALREVLEEKTNKLPGIMQTHSFAVIETVKDARSGLGG